MEELQQGPINNPCLVEGDLDVGWLEELVGSYGTYNEDVSTPNSEGKMPFLQMLQTVETSVPTSVTPATTFSFPNPLIHEPNYFQLLLRLQHEKTGNYSNFSCNLASPSELDSCVTNINNRNHPVKQEPVMSPKKCTDVHQKAKSMSKRSNFVQGEGNVVPKEKRKRKKPSKPAKNTEEVETQRMTHIAVERNRRRQMNEHLNTLRSFMPSSYVQRGDQASIIGGAIDYVKEMEQMLESLQAQKAMRHQPDEDENNIITPTASSTSSSSNMINNMMFVSSSTSNQVRSSSSNGDSAENRSDFAEIKVVVIQNHVNLKIKCQRRVGQLLKAIVTFEQLRLTILHLNITSLQTLVHYSFNLKIEDDCQLRTADDVVRAVHHIFN